MVFEASGKCYSLIAKFLWTDISSVVAGIFVRNEKARTTFTVEKEKIPLLLLRNGEDAATYV